MFPTITLDGVSHMGFMSGSPPITVKGKDLTLDVPEAQAHQMAAEAMVDFISTTLLGNPSTYDMSATTALTDPIVNAMELEGFYKLKPACYEAPLVGSYNVTCGHGAPWHNYVTQAGMGGDLGAKVQVSNDDNFHLVQDTHPIHLPTITSTCDGSKSCDVDTVTVSENHYSSKDSLDTGYFPIAATEMKTKLKSRQSLQAAAGIANPDFSVTDETGNRCADINDVAIKWAYNQLNDV